MPLTVLNVAYPLAPVGPDAVGGAEQILSALDEALVRAGHRSLVVACEGSRCHGTLLATPRPRGRLDAPALARAQAAHRRTIRVALARERVDLVHLHGIDFERYLPAGGPPAVVTLHLPPAWYAPSALRPSRDEVTFVCVSDSQRRFCPAGLAPELVPNGVAVERFRFRDRKRGFALALGRICPEKGFQHAIDAAALAEIALALAGSVFGYPEHLDHFRDAIAPRLDHRRRFLGPVGFARKRRLLAGARCLLVPSLAPETSSLVAMEALASGTPVIAYRAGALPEVVEVGRTGLLVESVEEMARAIGAVNRLRPRDCRRAAEEHFSHAAMTGRYLRLYERLAGARRPRTGWRVDELTTLAQLEAIAEEWRELWGCAPAATPFQHPDWLLPWCRAFRPERPWVLALRRGGRLEALAPFVIYPGARGERIVGLLGGGVSDYADCVVGASCGQEGGSQLVAHLLHRAEAWDRAELEPLRPGSPLLAAAAQAGRAGLAEAIAVEDVCTGLPLGRGASARAAIPRGTLDKLAYYRRRLARLGGVVASPAARDGPEALVEQLSRLHGARWRSRGQAGMLADARVAQFHREVARTFDAQGLLTSEGVWLDGRWTAALYGFVAGGRFYSYLTGFDPAYERLSLGVVVLGAAIDTAIARGASAADFLRGREPYKFDWGVEERPLYRRRVWRASADARADASE